jgi:hypothetical protein
MPNTSRWITVGAVTGGIVVLALATVLPVILAGSVAVPPPPPATRPCPAGAAQLAGRQFTAASLPSRDLTCADLRDTVFDGLDLSQYGFGRADLRGASFRHTQLIQADLHGSRLGGADLTSADLSQADLSGADLRAADLTLTDLTQADLTGADLRGARLWLVGSIQAQVSGTRVDIVSAGVVQLGYLSVAVALWRLIRWLVGLGRRGRVEPGASRWRWRPQPLRTAAFIPLALLYAGALYLMGRNLAALWAVDLVRPFLVAAAILLITAVAQQLGPTTPVPVEEISD